MYCVFKFFYECILPVQLSATKVTYVDGQVEHRTPPEGIVHDHNGTGVPEITR